MEAKSPLITAIPEQRRHPLKTLSLQSGFSRRLSSSLYAKVYVQMDLAVPSTGGHTQSSLDWGHLRKPLLGPGSLSLQCPVLEMSYKSACRVNSYCQGRTGKQHPTVCFRTPGVGHSTGSTKLDRPHRKQFATLKPSAFLGM